MVAPFGSLRRSAHLLVLARSLHLLLVCALGAVLSACAPSEEITGSSIEANVTPKVSPTVTISSNRSSVPSGGITTLIWSSTNATACTASGAWAGTEPVSGMQSTGALSANATYTLSCTGPGGSTQQSTTVTIGTPVSTTAGATCSAT